jgi:3-hydroxyisobutyrate dehydrogenase-like beta-hydroxyacid dehydrogenase
LKKIGYIGLGNMGKLMSGRLLSLGYSVSVYDILPAAVEEMANKGAIPANSAAMAVKMPFVVCF